MKIKCAQCGGLGVADVSIGEQVVCAHRNHVATAVPAPKPVSGGGVVLVFGTLVIAAGIFAALFTSRANGGEIMLAGLLLYVIGQLDLTNAHLARLNGTGRVKTGVVMELLHHAGQHEAAQRRVWLRHPLLMDLLAGVRVAGKGPHRFIGVGQRVLRMGEATHRPALNMGGARGR